MDYFFHILIFGIVYAILGQSLSLIVGHTGQYSLAQAGFFGLGAYLTAIFTVNYGAQLLFTVPVTLFIVGLISSVIAQVSLRTIDDYYIIITLGIQYIFFSVFNNWISVTNGPMGIASIPNIEIMGYELESKLSYMTFSLFLLGMTWILLSFLIKSPYGKLLRALSEDELFCESLGKNINSAKISSFMISCNIASMAGLLYAHYVSYIDPGSFTVEESIFVFSIVIIGGMRNLLGVFIAAIFLTFLPEILRFMGVPSSVASNIRQIIYGGLLVLVICWPRSRKNTSI